jgi:hypothetical protein
VVGVREAAKPRFPPMRAVVETQWSVVNPASTSVSNPLLRSLASRSVPMNALFTSFSITGSPSESRSHDLFDLVLFLTRSERRPREPGHVFDMKDRPVASSPGTDEPRDVPLRGRVVPPPPSGLIEPLLDVGHEQDRVVKEPRSGTAGGRASQGAGPDRASLPSSKLK